MVDQDKLKEAILENLKKREDDPFFQQRLDSVMERNRDLHDRLAQDD